METGIFNFGINFLSRGSSRSSSCFDVMPLELGPLASAPISIMSAPSFCSSKAFLRA